MRIKKIAGDNRTQYSFDKYYENFLFQGGNDLIFGKGPGSFKNEAEKDMLVSTYKILIINYGIVGVALMLLFYIISTYYFKTSMHSWFLCFLFILSAYQRPQLLDLYVIVMFYGGLGYLKNVNPQFSSESIGSVKPPTKIIFNSDL